MNKIAYYFTFVICLLFVSCDSTPTITQTVVEENIPNRWFNKTQVRLGEAIYKTQCISCHRENGIGAINWEQPIDGAYPPPPLNNNGHTWTHSFESLKNTIKKGESSYGNNMPPFGDKLSDAQVEQSMAYFQNIWTDETYNRWFQFISGLNKK